MNSSPTFLQHPLQKSSWVCATVVLALFMVLALKAMEEARRATSTSKMAIFIRFYFRFGYLLMTLRIKYTRRRAWTKFGRVEFRPGRAPDEALPSNPSASPAPRVRLRQVCGSRLGRLFPRAVAPSSALPEPRQRPSLSANNSFASSQNDMEVIQIIINSSNEEGLRHICLNIRHLKICVSTTIP